MKSKWMAVGLASIFVVASPVLADGNHNENPVHRIQQNLNSVQQEHQPSGTQEHGDSHTEMDMNGAHSDNHSDASVEQHGDSHSESTVTSGHADNHNNAATEQHQGSHTDEVNGSTGHTEEGEGGGHGHGPVVETPPNYKVLSAFGAVNLIFILIGVWNKYIRNRKKGMPSCQS